MAINPVFGSILCFFQPERRVSFRAFTLAELLIALTILSVIATFTIPKVLSSQQKQQRAAVLKETIATLDNMFYLTAIQSQVSDSTDLLPIVQTMIGYSKLCASNDPVAEGCWTSAMGNPGLQNNNYVSFQLPSGAVVLGLGNATNSTLLTGQYTQYVIDWNGPALPNVEGDDQLYLQYCYNQAACPTPGTGYTGKTVMLSHPRGANSVSLFMGLFS